jgi:hypothetical protein
MAIKQRKSSEETLLIHRSGQRVANIKSNDYQKHLNKNGILPSMTRKNSTHMRM